MSLAALVAIVALCAAVVTAAFVRAAPRLGLVDVPNARSSHAVPVPRGGGVALLGGAAIGIALTRPLDTDGLSPAALGAGAGALVVALVGLADDRYRLAPLPKLLGQLTAAGLLVAGAGGLPRLPLPAPLDVALGPLGVPLAVVWIVAVVNFYNFMDGIDGIASLQGAVAGAGLALAAWSAPAAVLGGALAGGCLGFLVHNWSPARVFLGDVGSGTLGFAFAAAPFLAAPRERTSATLFVALSLWPFLADATWTLVARVLRGARWHEAHREHAYQRLVISGWSHARVATLAGATAAVTTALALAAWRSGAAVAWWSALGAAVALVAAEIGLARRAATPPRGGAVA